MRRTMWAGLVAVDIVVLGVMGAPLVVWLGVGAVTVAMLVIRYSMGANDRDNEVAEADNARVMALLLYPVIAVWFLHGWVPAAWIAGGAWIVGMVANNFLARSRVVHEAYTTATHTPSAGPKSQ